MLDYVDVNKQSNPLEDSATARNSSCITSLEIGPIFVSETARYETKREERFAEGTASLPASAQGDPGVDRIHDSRTSPYTCGRNGHETRNSEQALLLRHAVLFVQGQFWLESPS